MLLVIVPTHSINVGVFGRILITPRRNDFRRLALHISIKNASLYQMIIVRSEIEREMFSEYRSENVYHNLISLSNAELAGLYIVPIKSYSKIGMPLCLPTRIPWILRIVQNT
jgi:hypothetical protein